MPKLCDIVKPGVPCKVKHEYYDGSMKWTGEILVTGRETQCVANRILLFSDGWQLDEPTVESVMREREIEMASCHSSSGGCYAYKLWKKSRLSYFQVTKSDFDALTVAAIIEISNLLDKYK